MRKLLITNDDGIDAPGIQALVDAARHFGEPIVVAPAEAHSGCGHRVTTDGPFRVERRANGFAVRGTPADCVRVAFHDLATDVDLVLSGINSGGNLGADVWHSGTVAAVREAAFHGGYGVAFSQYRRRGLAVDWERAASWVRQVLNELLVRPRESGVFWNVNLPHLDAAMADPIAIACPLERAPLPLRYIKEGDHYHYDGDYHNRQRQAGSDVDVCFRGQIAVTRLSVHDEEGRRG